MSTTKLKRVEHSPLPWTVEHNGRARTDIATPEELTGGYLVLTMNPDAPCREANAELIVRAVNSHADMLEALEGLLAHRECPVNSPEADIARAAIAKARGIA